MQPPNLLRAAGAGAVGSLSVRTNSARTTYASGFATIGAGSRIDVPAGAPQPYGHQLRGLHPLTITGIERIDDLAAQQGYSLATPGSLGAAVAEAGITEAGGVAAIGNQDAGLTPPVPVGLARYPTLAAMDAAGRVAVAATGADLLERAPDAPFGVRTDETSIRAAVADVLSDPCAVAVIDHGDLVRADDASRLAADPAELSSARDQALVAADALLEEVMATLDADRDLLLITTPSSPSWDPDIHFGVAVALGPGFGAGQTLSSPSTRRSGMVTLPDVAPTVLRHVRVERPGDMLGRSWFSAPAGDAGARIEQAIDLDREAVFIDSIRTPVSTAFVGFQLLVYAAAVSVLVRGSKDRSTSAGPARILQSAALLLAAFPLATYAAGVVQGHRLGAALYWVVLLAITGVVVAVVNTALSDPLDRLLAVVGLTFSVLVIDLVAGAPLQLNTVFSYSPLVAGRFAGIGNIGFAILAATSVLTGALLIHRFGSSFGWLAAVAGLFVVTVVIDGAPQFGSDVGGAIALVPGLAVTWLLIAGKRPSLVAVAAAVVGGAVVLGVFLALDLARPEDSQTHLARLYQDVRSEGGQVFADAITRKVRTNLRVLGSTIWTFLVPPALGLLAWLLLRPRWQWLSQTHPKVRAGLLGGLIMAVLGYAVNDSGIVIPAMMFSYLVPAAVAPLAREKTSAADRGA